MMRCLLPALALGACSVDVAPVGEPTLLCERDAQCPDGWLCATAGRRCVQAASRDTVGATVLSAVAESPTSVLVAFDEELGPAAAENPASYTIQGAGDAVVAVLEARVLEDGQRVRLTTGAQVAELTYELSAGGVSDIWGNPPANAVAIFTGFGTAASRAPPELVAPRPGERVLGEQVDLIWAPRPQARSYSVEVALDEGFASLAVPSITVEAEDPTSPPPSATRVVLSAARRYYWRVRADVTEPGLYAVSTFSRMDDAIYVFCDEGEACDDALRAGNISEPVRSVRAGISLALLLGLDTVRIAARPAGAPYAEGIVQLPSGMNLLGGYDPTFAGRDVEASRPRIEGTLGAALIAQGLTAPTLLEGLHLVGPDLVDPGTTVGVVVSDTGDNLTVRSCTIEGGDVRSGSTLAMRIVSSADDDTHAPRIERSTLIGGNGTQAGAAMTTAAVKIESSSPLFVDNVLIAGGNGAADNSGPGGPGSVSYGIWMSTGAVLLDGNRTIRAGAGFVAKGLSLSGRTATILNNEMICGPAQGAPAGSLNYGIEASLGDGLLLRDNALVCGADAVLLQGRNPTLYGLWSFYTPLTVERTTIASAALSLAPGFTAVGTLKSYGIYLRASPVTEGPVTVVDSVIRAGDVLLPSPPQSLSWHVGIAAIVADLRLTRTRVELPNGGIQQLYGVTLNWEPPSGASVFDRSALSLTDTEIVLGANGANQGVARAIGVLAATPWEVNPILVDNLDVSSAAMPDAVERVGLWLDNPSGLMQGATILLHGSAGGGVTEAVRVRTPSPDWAPLPGAATFSLRNSSLYAGSSSLATGVSSGLSLPSHAAHDGGWTLLAANNTLAAGSASDAGAVQVAALGARAPSQLYFANNLLASLGGGAGDTCLDVAGSTFAATLDRAQSNAFVGCAGGACDSSSCYGAAAFDALDGAGGALDGNADIALADAAFASTIDPVDLALGPGTRASVCELGADLSTAGLCPAAGACLTVSDDLEGRARSAPFAVGAYERDGCVP